MVWRARVFPHIAIIYSVIKKFLRKFLPRHIRLPRHLHKLVTGVSLHSTTTNPSNANSRDPGLKRARSSRHEFRRIFQQHELFRSHGQQRIRSPVTSGKLHFKRTAVVSHHDRSHLPAPEHQRLAGCKMLRRQVFKQDHHVVHLDAVVHRFKL